jgi:hypothetical protein
MEAIHFVGVMRIYGMLTRRAVYAGVEYLSAAWLTDLLEQMDVDVDYYKWNGVLDEAKQDMFSLEIETDILLRLSVTVKEICRKSGLEAFDLWEFTKGCLNLVFVESPVLEELEGLEGIIEMEESDDSEENTSHITSPTKLEKEQELLLNNLSYSSDKEVNVKRIKKQPDKLEFMN